MNCFMVLQDFMEFLDFHQDVVFCTHSTWVGRLEMRLTGLLQSLEYHKSRFSRVEHVINLLINKLSSKVCNKIPKAIARAY